MKPMMVAFLAMGVISVGAWYTLSQMGFDAGEANAGPAVRLGDADE